jgi:hypothetical protein
MESEDSKGTRQARLYVDDVELLKRKARTETIRRNRIEPVSIAEIVHEQLAQLRIDERAEQKAGDNVQEQRPGRAAL